MSGLMKLCGGLLVVVAIALILMLKLSSAQMQVWGIGPDTIATLLVGGILSLGLGGVIDALTGKASPASVSVSAPSVPTSAVKDVLPEMEIETPAPKTFGFGRKKVEAPAAEVEAAVPAVAAAAAVATTVASTSVSDTIAALEQAKADIKTAIGGVDSLASPEPEAAIEPQATMEVEEAALEPAAEGELYVVQEKIIRGRPARILSDDTVEAETDEGWMRFENLEHLNEYLDSIEDDEA